ncbi:MAG: hypothetical protein K6E21_02585 [Bacilli bacterium]|nr:hypothetical protein [Bacilli bacterium]
MRRIWAHIIIAITSIVMMVVTFATISNKLNVGMDYASGKTLTFHVTEKTDNGENNPKEFTDKTVGEVAKIMEDRLKAAEMQSFDVAPFGDDLVKVTLFDESDYSQLKEYLSFDGSLYLYSFDNEKLSHSIGSEVFVNSDKPAYLTGTNDIYPTINIPVDIENEKYKEVAIGAINSEQITVKAESSEGAGDAEYAKYMYLVYDFVPERDSFEDSNFQSKVLLKFQVKSESTEENDKDKIFDYYKDGDVYALSTVLNIADAEGNVDEKNVPTAWKNGKFYVNLLNAGAYGYDVTCIHEEVAAPKVEALYSLGKNQTVFESSTFVAFSCAIVLISLVLIVFYKLGALSISVTSFASAFLGFLFLMIFKSEFNLLAVVGLALVALASLASGCIYLNKFKDEAYRGRSVKKANTEASKKSSLVVADIHFALLVLGAFTYLIGGVGLESFSLVVVLGGLVSLILNLTVFKGFMWLDTNASVAQNKYELFGVDETKVPNLVDEEKQSYFGPYADKDFNKKPKLASILAGVGFVATLAAMLVFGIVKGSVYNNPAKSYENEIFVKIDNENEVDFSIITSNLESVLNDVKLSNGSEADSLSAVTDSPVLLDFNVLEYDSEEENPFVQHSYGGYIVKITGELPETVYYEGNGYKMEELFSYNNSTNVIAERISSACINIEYASGESTTESNPVFYKVAIAVGAALLTTTLYLLLRYRLSRGLGSFVTVLAGATIVGGLLSLLYFIPATNTAVVGLAVGEFISVLFAILFMNKERELVLDDKKHDNSYENRNELMKKAVSYGFGDILNIALVGLFLGLIFLGFGPGAMRWISLEIIIAVALAFTLAMFVLGPVSQFFFKKFANIGTVKPRKSKSKGPVQNKSAEPEEAIFIGIND